LQGRACAVVNSGRPPGRRREGGVPYESQEPLDSSGMPRSASTITSSRCVLIGSRINRCAMHKSRHERLVWRKFHVTSISRRYRGHSGTHTL